MTIGWIIFFITVAAGIVGIAIGWVLRTLNLPVSPIEKELRQQRDSKEAELSRLQGELTQLMATKATLEAEKSAAQDSYKQSDAKATQLQRDIDIIKDNKSRIESELQLANERLSAERKQIEAMQEKFQGISNQLLLDNSTRFNEQSSQSLKTLLEPLNNTLEDFKKSIDTTRQETATNSALLKDQITRIGTEASNLSKALKGEVKTLGNWGENMLDQILDKSGLQKDIHYRKQQNEKDDEGKNVFLDVIIDLPEKHNLIIDSKASIRDYEGAVNAQDESLRIVLLEKHIDSLRAHFKGLGAKKYQDIYNINTPDFVLMYVPIDGAFFAAIAHEPKLFQEALDNNVILTTNSTLLATLRTVAHVWRLADHKKNAQIIAKKGGALYDKFFGFIADLDKIGSSLEDSHKTWEEAKKKLHTGRANIVRQVEQLRDLGVKADKSLPSILLEVTDEDDSLLPVDKDN